MAIGFFLGRLAVGAAVNYAVRRAVLGSLVNPLTPQQGLASLSITVHSSSSGRLRQLIDALQSGAFERRYQANYEDQFRRRVLPRLDAQCAL